MNNHLWPMNRQDAHRFQLHEQAEKLATVVVVAEETEH
jgi:hypothetical protein